MRRPRRGGGKGDRRRVGYVAIDDATRDFEGALAELERIVKTLEDGDLSLERSLELYERGVALSRFCHQTLEAAERRIEVLTERGDLKPAPDLATDSAARPADERR